MSVLKKLIAIALFLTPFVGLHATQIYKWTDSEGNIHFGEAPPPQQQADKIRLPKSSTNPPAQPAPAANTNGNDETPPADSALADHFKKNCDIATKNLQTYKTTRHFVQADGSVKEISEEEQMQKIKESEEAVGKYCK